MAETAFRGYASIGEVMKRMTKLIEWTRQFKPQQQHMTLQRTDYDLIKRWPKAAAAHGISVVDNGRELWYRGLELTYDGGPRRYERPPTPVQTDIEGETCDHQKANCQH